MRPPRSILDPNFVYRNSANTDIRKTFERLRRKDKAPEQKVEHPPVISLVRKNRG